MRPIKRALASGIIALSAIFGTAVLTQADDLREVNPVAAPALTTPDAQAVQMAQATPINREARNATVLIFNTGARVYNNAYVALDFDALSARILSNFPAANLTAAGVDPTVAPANPQELFNTIERLVLTAENNDYFALSDTVLQAFVGSLDAHSSYVTHDEAQAFRERTTGQFGGLGLQVQKDELTGYVRIEGLMDGGAGGAAGVLQGDLITSVGGRDTSAMPLDEAVNAMRGQLGTSVDITIQREGEADLIALTVTRQIVRQSAVHATILDGNIGYAAISSFTELVSDDLTRAFTEMEAGATAPSAYILDLRGNPGGLLTQAGEVADRFLTTGKIVAERDRDGETGSYTARPDDIINGKPLIVLIDGGSASASEIVSGALQRFDRAVIIGTQSFGKGSVQTIMPVERGMLRLTTQLYYVGGDTPIQGYGVMPDIRVAFGIAAEMEALITRREAALDGVIANPNAGQIGADTAPNTCAPASTAPDAFDSLGNRFRNPATGQVDSAMLCAIEYLNGQATYTVINPTTAGPRP